jgi:hypothetical protein
MSLPSVGPHRQRPASHELPLRTAATPSTATSRRRSDIRAITPPRGAAGHDGGSIRQRQKDPVSCVPPPLTLRYEVPWWVTCVRFKCLVCCATPRKTRTHPHMQDACTSNACPHYTPLHTLPSNIIPFRVTPPPPTHTHTHHHHSPPPPIPHPPSPPRSHSACTAHPSAEQE